MKTVKQLAAQLGVSKSTLHRLIQKLNQDCVIETVQRDNKILIDDVAEKAIIQAYNEKSSHGDASCTDAETAQKRVKSESCSDFETKYIESLEQQIIDLKADKEDLQQRLNNSEQERQTLLVQLLELRQQTKVIEVKTAEQQTVKPQTVKRSAPKQPQTIMDAVRSFFTRHG